jgi:hypothetical protein
VFHRPTWVFGWRFAKILVAQRGGFAVIFCISKLADLIERGSVVFPAAVFVAV